jgi:two-component system LytT family response regulator
MSGLSAVILDDEKAAVEILYDMLSETEEFEKIVKLTDPKKLEAAICKNDPDVIFLDVEMPGYNGIEVLKNLREYRPQIPVIYVTAHKEFAYDAAKNNPYSFLLKPVKQDELFEVLNKLKVYLTNIKDFGKRFRTKIKLPVKDGFIYIENKEVLLLKAEGNYTNIILSDEKVYNSSYNLGKLYNKYFSSFLRINRSTIVNGYYLKEVNKKKKFCVLKTDLTEKELEISTTFLRNFHKEF